MDTSEKRIIGSLILLLGVTLLSIALYANQLPLILELMKNIFEPSVAGVP
ncbi:MAG: hypothetical protein JSV64_04690 [Candidatus Bathyarchaeota archaeon]|nr:MAG: hypothetical protein JSV64_04690 [Candidatus Bathyarchaeota archaeon]